MSLLRLSFATVGAVCSPVEPPPVKGDAAMGAPRTIAVEVFAPVSHPCSCWLLCMAIRWCSLKEDALCRLGCIAELFDTERRGAARYLYQRRTQKSPREVVLQPLVTTLRSECAWEPKVLGSRHRSKLQLSLTARQPSHRPQVGLLKNHESPQRTEALTHCRSTDPAWHYGKMAATPQLTIDTQMN